MAKKQQTRKKRQETKPNDKSSKPNLKEVSIDDVVKQLIDLCDHLGIDAGGLATRFTHIKSAKSASKRIFPHVAAIGELLRFWHQDPYFLDSSGHPLPLRMRGNRRSFTVLAKRSVPKVSPIRLLSELKRIGVVATDSKKLIRVQMRSLPVYEDRHLARQHTLTSLHSFIKTLRHNLNSPPSNSDQLFHRIAANGAFDVRDIPALKIRVKRHAQSFLESSDNWMARRLTGRKRNSRSKVAQVAIGVYLSVDRA